MATHPGSIKVLLDFDVGYLTVLCQAHGQDRENHSYPQHPASIFSRSVETEPDIRKYFLAENGNTPIMLILFHQLSKKHLRKDCIGFQKGERRGEINVSPNPDRVQLYVDVTIFLFVQHESSFNTFKRKRWMRCFSEVLWCFTPKSGFIYHRLTCITTTTGDLGRPLKTASPLLFALAHHLLYLPPIFA